MKQYVVILSQRAENDLYDIRDYIATRSPWNASRFVAKLENAILSLEDLAGSLGRPSEAEEKGLSDIRQLVFGEYRIIYRIRGETAEVITVINGARRLRL